LEVLSVGRSRFPLQIKYPKDLTIKLNHGTVVQAAKDVEKLTIRAFVSINDVQKAQYRLAFSLITTAIETGTGVLVFVSGMNDILELAEKFEGLAGFRVFAIHSDIPFEEQEAAFLPTPANEIKVVLATNAAESSITLPHVDVVICLGTHKTLEYNYSSRRILLLNSWISKASATQRAGRTGRLRPGTVYRLYSDKLHDTFEEYDTSELKKTPLHNIILSLRHMLENSEDFKGVVPVLQDLLEPPDVVNINCSFEYLYSERMITEPNDSCELTIVGDLVAQLPVDCQLGKLIAYGIRLGCAPECVVLAAALMQPKKLFRVATPFIHKDPDELNAIVRITTAGAFKLDAGLFSEPMM
jgi:HrpA-like RNA helicase